MLNSRIRGAKKDKGQARKPVISKDTVSSTSVARIQYIMSEGVLADSAISAKNIFLDGTPLEDEKGNRNFEGVEFDWRNGTNDQTYMEGFPDLSNEIGIGVELRSGTPYIKAFNNTQLDALRVRFRWNALSKTDSKNGDVKGYRIDYAIDIQTDGGAYQEVLNTSLTGKTSAGYEKSHRIPLPDARTGWQIRIRRITPNDTSEYVRDTMIIDAITEVMDVKLNYPNSAVLGISFPAETFSGIPKLALRCRGIVVRVPSNYNPVTRTYTGVWNGLFKDAYTQNPAWIYYDICLSKRYGLGRKLDATMIDKWSIYQLGQFCDQKVPDGKGGLEPRFSCNVYFQDRMEAYSALSSLAGMFRSMSYWDGKQITLDADMPKDPVYTFSRANVVVDEGGANPFSYTGSSNRDRHTVVKVAWDNPDNNFNTEYVYVRDEKAIARNGVKVLDLPAFACTSESQAQRLGLYALKTEQLETRQVSFRSGLDGFIPKVGNIISISDDAFAGRVVSGRVANVNSTQLIVTVDRDVVAKAGDVLIVNGNNGISQRRSIRAISGRKITVTSAFTGIDVQHIWAIEADDLKLMRFRLMSVSQNDDATFSISALQHEPLKFAAIDFGVDVKPPNYTVITPNTIDPPESVFVKSRHRIVQAQTITTLVIEWTQVKEAVAYEVEWRKDDGAWIKVPRTGNMSVEVDGVYSGRYLARVRSVSPFDVVSLPTTSMQAEIKGKVGLPPVIIGLQAKGVLFGMKLSWGFGAGADDSAYTEIEVGNLSSAGVLPQTIVRPSLNLFDASKTTNEFISSGGVVGAGGTYHLSDYIAVNPSTRYAITGLTTDGRDTFTNVSYFDANKVWISRVNAVDRSTGFVTVLTPSNAAYVRLNINGDPKEKNRMFSLGNSRPANYEPAGIITINSATTGDENVGLLGQFSYPTNTAELTGLQGGLKQAYRARLIDKLGQASEWSHWVQGETDDSVSEMLDILNGKLTSSQLDIDLRAEIEKITDNTAQISQETQDRIQAIIDAEAGFVQKITEVKEDNEYQYTLIDQAIARTDATVAGVQREVTTNTNKVGALSQTVNTVVAKADANTAAIAKTDKAVADANQSIAESKTEILAEFNGMEVGGHNLIAKSVFDNNYLNSYGKGNYYLLADKTATGGIRVDSNSVEPNAVFGFIFFGSDAKKISLRAGVEYTLSFYGQSTLSSLNYCYIMRDDMPNIGLPSVPISSGYNTQRSITFTLDEDVTNGYLLIATRGKQGDWFALNGLMLQRGNKPTAWTKSPLDFDDAISKNEAAIVRTDKAVADANQSIASAKTELRADYRALATANTNAINKEITDRDAAVKQEAINRTAAIKQESIARADAVSALSKTVDTVQTTVGDIKTLHHYKMGGDSSNWTNYAGSGEVYAGSTLVIGNNAGDDQVWYIRNENIALKDGIVYKITARVRNLTEGNALYVGVAAVAADGTTFINRSDGNSYGNQYYVKNYTNYDRDYRIVTGYIGTANTKLPAGGINLPAAAKFFRPLVIANYPNKAGKAYFDYFNVETVDGLSISSIQEVKESVDGAYAKWSMKLDVNGYVGGLTGGNNGQEIDFILRTDAFTLAPPSGNSNNINAPFTFRTTPATINGTVFPVAAYLKAAFIDALSVDTGHIKNLAVKSAQIDNLAVTRGKIGRLAVDSLQLEDEAVIIPALQYTAGTATQRVARAELEINRVAIDPKGGSVSVSFGFERLTASDFGEPVTITISLLRNGETLREYRFGTSGGRVDHRWITVPSFFDSPPQGLAVYTVSMRAQGWGENYITTNITGRSLQIMGVKKGGSS